MVRNKMMKAVKLTTDEEYDSFLAVQRKIEDLKLNDLVDLRNDIIW